MRLRRAFQILRLLGEFAEALPVILIVLCGMGGLNYRNFGQVDGK